MRSKLENLNPTDARQTEREKGREGRRIKSIGSLDRANGPKQSICQLQVAAGGCKQTPARFAIFLFDKLFLLFSLKLAKKFKLVIDFLAQEIDKLQIRTKKK